MISIRAWELMARGALLLVLGGCGVAAAPTADAAPFAGPDGWRQMCAATPQYCNIEATPAPQELATADLAELEAVNRLVNGQIAPRHDPAGADHWTLAPAHGDCEDYALTKKDALLARGWPGAALRFAAVLTETGEYHAVLLVDTAAGPLVLDNRSALVAGWAEVEAGGYRLIAVEGADAAGGWQITEFGRVFAMLAGNPPTAAR